MKMDSAGNRQAGNAAISSAAAFLAADDPAQRRASPLFLSFCFAHDAREYRPALPGWASANCGNCHVRVRSDGGDREFDAMTSAWSCVAEGFGGNGGGRASTQSR